MATLDENATYAWGYAPPSHLEGEPDVPIPEGPPGMDVPGNQPFRLPSGVVAYRETVGHRQRLMELERQQAAARQAAQQAAMDAKMLDQMSRVAKSTRDIEIARRSIDVMGLQRDIQNGVPIYQAITRHPLALGAGYGTGLRATAPQAQAKWVPATAGGAPGHFQLPTGGVSVPPQKEAPMATPAPIKLPDGTRIIQVSPQHYQVLEKEDLTPKPGSLSDVENKRLEALQREESDIRRDIARLSASDAKRVVGLNRLGWIRIERERILHGQSQNPSSAAQGRTLTPDLAAQFLQQAGGDKEKAREAARAAGYTF